MALLHLIDRPEETAINLRSRNAIGATASAASHVVAALVLIAALRNGTAPAAATPPAIFAAPRFIWIPNLSDGGGRQGGGNQAQQPARPMRAPGDEAASVAAMPQPASTSVTEPPPAPIEISARPTGHANQWLPGPITSDRPGDALGPNLGPGGDGDGPTAGRGNGPNGFGNGVARGGPGVTTPVLIHQVKPQYTADAMRAKMQGSVWLECIVLPDGSVGDVRVTRSLDRRFGLDDQAIAAAKQWRFKPGLLKGQPVAVAITIELTFTLR